MLKELIKNKKVVLPVVGGLLALAVFFVGFYIGGNRVSIDETETPLTDPYLYLDLTEAIDYTDTIQSAMYEAASAGKTLVLENPTGNVTYLITKTLMIPDGLAIDGNGVKLLVDEAVGFTPAANTNTYNEFLMMTEGFITKQNTTFNMHNLKFEYQNHAATRDIPKTLLAISRVENVSITNCSFAVYSDTQLGLNALDLYSRWRNVEIRGCEFIVETDAPTGGVWVRNANGGDVVAGDGLIEDCYFYKRAADEILGVYATSSGQLENVMVQNCTFDVDYSQYNNPTHAISIGTTGINKNLTLQNCEINIAKVNNSAIKILSEGEADQIYVLNNKINIDDVMKTSNYVITGDKKERECVVQGNIITVNTQSDMRKSGVYGTAIKLIDNEFYGNGFSYITQAVEHVEGNYVERCSTAFQGAVTLINNTVMECTGNFIHVYGSTVTGTPDDRKAVEVIGNVFMSSTRAALATTTSNLYCDIYLEGNLFENVRVALSNKTTTNVLEKNVLFLESLDQFVTSGRTTGMDGNLLLNVSMAPENLEEELPAKTEGDLMEEFIQDAFKTDMSMVTSARSPTGLGLRNSIPVGTVFIVADYEAEYRLNGSFPAGLDGSTRVAYQLNEGRTWSGVTLDQLNAIIKKNESEYTINKSPDTNIPMASAVAEAVDSGWVGIN